MSQASPGLRQKSFIQRDDSDLDMLDNDSNKKYSKINNHYEVPNMSSMLYEFTNKEQEKELRLLRVILLKQQKKLLMILLAVISIKNT